MLTTLFANTKEGNLNQYLVQHLYAVGVLSKKLCYHVTKNEKMEKCAYLSACLHDIGKVDSVFQKSLLPTKTYKFENFKKIARHNEVSTVLVDYLCTFKDKNIKDMIRHSVLYHHSIPFRKDKITHSSVYEKCSRDGLFDIARNVLLEIDKLAKDTTFADMLKDEVKKDYDLKFDQVPFKRYDCDDMQIHINTNARNDIIRWCLKMCDRYVSSLSNDQLHALIQLDFASVEIESLIPQNKTGALTKWLKPCLDNFSASGDKTRNIEQQKAVDTLYNQNIPIKVLGGACGVGKTKTALMVASTTKHNRIFWVCPRVLVCQNVYNELSDIFRKSDVCVELVTGEYKKNCTRGVELNSIIENGLKGDIVVIQIDQLINILTDNMSADFISMFDVLHSFVVFDEFHECKSVEMSMVFSEWMSLFKQTGLTTPLLVSGTPNPMWLKEIADVDVHDIVRIDSFNRNQFTLKHTINDVSLLKMDVSGVWLDQEVVFNTSYNTIVVAETATSMQNSYMNNQYGILYHHKFTTSDKSKLFNIIMRRFGTKGDREGCLRSGPVLQASLNITSKNIVTEFSCAENIIQRICGRRDRFGECVNGDSVALIVEPPKKHSTRNHLRENMHSLVNANQWLLFLQKFIGMKITNNDVYDAYYDFYDSSKKHKHYKLVHEEMKKMLKASAVIANSLYECKVEFMIDPNEQQEDKPKLLADISLRGQSRFVQMVEYNTDEYGASVSNDTYVQDDMLLEWSQLQQLYQDGFILKNHINYLKNKFNKTKYEVSPEKIKWLSRDASNPIYTSYVNSDVDTYLGVYGSNANQIVYSIGVNQPIGMISFDKLITNQTQED